VLDCKGGADAGMPRDGGMADLLAEAASPAPRFAAVVCEDIERSGRDMFNALKLERNCPRQGIPLFATDEPADIQGVNATTVLVRRVKQTVAEWYRIQLKEKVWKGLVEHSLDGWNIGTPPYGYRAERIPHPVPFKADQGRTKSHLILDPVRAPVIAQMHAWRTVGKLGCLAIAARLNADPAAYPPPNPRRDGPRRTSGSSWPTPSTPGTWSTAGTPPATAAAPPTSRTSGCGPPLPCTRPSWTGPPGKPPRTPPPPHGTSRDGDDPNAHPATRRAYPPTGPGYGAGTADAG
jgi:site-specific DNA recombinase